MASRAKGDTAGAFSAAVKYLEAGWLGPLPVGHGPHQKAPTPVGYTGNDGDWPSQDQVEKWASSNGARNIALRLPEDVIGIDVDDYDAKRGGDTMAAVSEAHGRLDRTWVSTSRDDLSGIRWFRLAKPGKLPGKLIHPEDHDQSDVEVIQHTHRYALVPPSIHPLGGLYRWVKPGGTQADNGEYPSPSDFPLLPDSWYDHIKHDCSCWSDQNTLRDLRAPRGAPVADTYDRWSRKLASGYGRHDAALSGVLALVAFRQQGWPGAEEHLEKLRVDFFSSLGDSRSEREAESKWGRMVDGAEAKAQTTQIPRYDDRTRLDWIREVTAADLNLDASFAAVPGGTWVLDTPEAVPTLWGLGNEIAWAAGETLMIAGADGTGKTVLAHNLILRLTGLIDTPLLGLAVEQRKRVLYLAQDRPRQAQRAFRRMIGKIDEDALNESLVVIEDPLPTFEDNPEILAQLAQANECDTVIVDSLKDMAIELSSEPTGQAVRRAYQLALGEGVEVCLLHHNRKPGQSQSKRALSLADVYGSRWMVAGCGSVIALNGSSGDPIVDLRHLKQVIEEVGPLPIRFDFQDGYVEVHEGGDLLSIVLAAPKGLTVRDAARTLYETDKPNRSDVERARRKLESLSGKGHINRIDGEKKTDPKRYINPLSVGNSFTDSFTQETII